MNSLQTGHKLFWQQTQDPFRLYSCLWFCQSWSYHPFYSFEMRIQTLPTRRAQKLNALIWHEGRSAREREAQHSMRQTAFTSFNTCVERWLISVWVGHFRWKSWKGVWQIAGVQCPGNRFPFISTMERHNFLNITPTYNVHCLQLQNVKQNYVPSLRLPLQ